MQLLQKIQVKQLKNEYNNQKILYNCPHKNCMGQDLKYLPFICDEIKHK